MKKIKNLACYEVELTSSKAQQSSCSHGSFIDIQDNGVWTHSEYDLMPTTIIKCFVREIVKKSLWPRHLQFYFQFSLVQTELQT
jgi:hypothetical protein